MLTYLQMIISPLIYYIRFSLLGSEEISNQNQFGNSIFPNNNYNLPRVIQFCIEISTLSFIFNFEFCQQSTNTHTPTTHCLGLGKHRQKSAVSAFWFLVNSCVHRLVEYLQIIVCWRLSSYFFFFLFFIFCRCVKISELITLRSN